MTIPTLTHAQRRAYPILAAVIECLREPSEGEECVELYPTKEASPKRVSAPGSMEQPQSPGNVLPGKEECNG